MPSIVLVVAGRLDARTGGSIYNRRMADALAQLGWAVDIRELHGAFPQPDQAALEVASRLFAALPAGTTAVVDGLALSTMPDIIARESARLRIVALVHLPIAADVGLDHLTSARFEAAERRALGAVVLIVVTGAGAIPLLARYDLPDRRVVVVEPGTDQAPVARGSGGPPHLLCVATLNPGKGHEVLLQALASLSAPGAGVPAVSDAATDRRGHGSGWPGPVRGWRLTCAGSLTRCPDTTARVRAAARDLQLEDRVSFAGDLDAGALARSYDAADLFVLPTRQETYGMAVAEALAHGLPVVSTTTGAIPAMVGDDAGWLVPPGDAIALAAALSRAIGDAPLRARMAEGARRARTRLPTWSQAARRFAAMLQTAGAGG